jgi:hypothetical protein
LSDLAMSDCVSQRTDPDSVNEAAVIDQQTCLLNGSFGGKKHFEVIDRVSAVLNVPFHLEEE